MSSSKECLFCTIPSERVIDENDLAYVIWDGYPVTPQHSLVIPKRHVTDYFSLNADEREACDALLKATRTRVEQTDPTVTAFNIGMNAGADAGQTIFHCHIHLIPRRRGDVENPRGGVRHVIPGKGFY